MELRRAIASYIVLRRAWQQLAPVLSDSTAHAELCLDDIEAELLERVNPATLDDVRRLPAEIQAAALAGMLDRAREEGVSEGLIDWCRIQVLGRADTVRTVLDDRTIQTATDLVRRLSASCKGGHIASDARFRRPTRTAL